MDWNSLPSLAVVGLIFFLMMRRGGGCCGGMESRPTDKTNVPPSSDESKPTPDRPPR